MVPTNKGKKCCPVGNFMIEDQSDTKYCLHVTNIYQNCLKVEKDVDANTDFDNESYTCKTCE